MADAACSPSRAEQASQLRAGGSSCSHSPARTRLGELSARSSAKASAGDRAAREGHSLVSSTGRAELKLPKQPPPAGLLQPVGLSSPKQGSGSDGRQNTLSCLLRQGQAQPQLSSWHRSPWLAAQLHPAARAFPNSVNTSWGLFITELAINVSPCRASSPSSWAALRVTRGR